MCKRIYRIHLYPRSLTTGRTGLIQLLPLNAAMTLRKIRNGNNQATGIITVQQRKPVHLPHLNKGFMNTTWRTALRKNLSKESCGLDSAQIRAVLAKYDELLAKGNSEQDSFAHIMETFASEDTSVAVANVQKQNECIASSICYSLESNNGKYIRENLETINRDNKIETNQNIRLKKAIHNAAKVFNANIAKCSITIKSQATMGRELEVLDDTDRKSIAQAIPAKENALRMEFESFAAFKRGRANLE